MSSGFTAAGLFWDSSDTKEGQIQQGSKSTPMGMLPVESTMSKQSSVLTEPERESAFNRALELHPQPLPSQFSHSQFQLPNRSNAASPMTPGTDVTAARPQYAHSNEQAVGQVGAVARRQQILLERAEMERQKQGPTNVWAPQEVEQRVAMQLLSHPDRSITVDKPPHQDSERQRKQQPVKSDEFASEATIGDESVMNLWAERNRQGSMGTTLGGLGGLRQSIDASGREKRAIKARLRAELTAQMEDDKIRKDKEQRRAKLGDGPIDGSISGQQMQATKRLISQAAEQDDTPGQNDHSVHIPTPDNRHVTASNIDNNPFRPRWELGRTGGADLNLHPLAERSENQCLNKDGPLVLDAQSDSGGCHAQPSNGPSGRLDNHLHTRDPNATPGQELGFSPRGQQAAMRERLGSMGSTLAGLGGVRQSVDVAAKQQQQQLQWQMELQEQIKQQQELQNHQHGRRAQGDMIADGSSGSNRTALGLDELPLSDYELERRRKKIATPSLHQSVSPVSAVGDARLQMQATKRLILQAAEQDDTPGQNDHPVHIPTPDNRHVTASNIDNNPFRPRWELGRTGGADLNLHPLAERSENQCFNKDGPLVLDAQSDSGGCHAQPSNGPSGRLDNHLHTRDPNVTPGQELGFSPRGQQAAMRERLGSMGSTLAGLGGVRQSVDVAAKQQQQQLQWQMELQEQIKQQQELQNHQHGRRAQGDMIADGSSGSNRTALGLDELPLSDYELERRRKSAVSSGTARLGKHWQTHSSPVGSYDNVLHGRLYKQNQTQDCQDHGGYFTSKQVSTLISGHRDFEDIEQQSTTPRSVLQNSECRVDGGELSLLTTVVSVEDSPGRETHANADKHESCSENLSGHQERDYFDRSGPHAPQFQVKCGQRIRQQETLLVEQSLTGTASFLDAQSGAVFGPIDQGKEHPGRNRTEEVNLSRCDKLAIGLEQLRSEQARAERGRVAESIEMTGVSSRLVAADSGYLPF
eukprot:SAG31_NODE_738_length_12447_cov_4.809848_4_plen_981_part_00